MALQYNKPTENDEKTINFKVALGIISFKKKEALKVSNAKNNNLKTDKI